MINHEILSIPIFTLTVNTSHLNVMTVWPQVSPTLSLEFAFENANLVPAYS